MEEKTKLPKWYNSKIIKIEDASPTTKRFWLEVQSVDRITFRAGQYIVCDLPISERRQKRWRSYSIANAPDETNIIEICIVYLEEGAGSYFFWEEAKVGTEISFKPPAGMFVLPNQIDTDLVMIATGTGVAPFRSMINNIYNQNIDHRNIHLIFGTRYEKGLLYRDEFEKLVEQYPEFNYDVSLSREQKPGTINGYLHSIYLERYQNNSDNTKFYLCGWSGMIDETVKNLTEKLGVNAGQIIYELYG